MAGRGQGFETKVFYVWFDAPIEYIAAVQEWANAEGGDWRPWWREDAGAARRTYVQFMGKDNVAFHAVSFPATLLGSREPWKTVDVLKAFNHLNWHGEKFSTSQRRGVFLDAALEILPPTSGVGISPPTRRRARTRASPGSNSPAS